MSADEEKSLRDMVANTLDAKGVLPKIRAELRANVFLALKEDPEVREKLLYNESLRTFAKTESGSIILSLIRDFLEFFNLDFTLSVFNPETRSGLDYQSLSTADLLSKLSLKSRGKSAPLLCDLLDFHKTVKSGVGDVNESLEVPSPMGLNSTYTKIEAEKTPIRLPDKISEEIQQKSDSSSETTPKSEVTNSETGHSTASDSSRDSPHNNGTNNDSINLLHFTPVQEVKTVLKSRKDGQSDKTDKPNSESSAVRRLDESLSLASVLRKDESLSQAPVLKKDESSTFLKDLPPLGFPSLTAKKQAELADIKTLLDSGKTEYMDDFSTGSSKDSKKESRSKSAGSDSTASCDEVEEELLNSHASSDGVQTVDESLSGLSNISGVDHIESV